MLVVPPVLQPAYWTPPRKRQPCLPILKEDLPFLPDLLEKMADYCRELSGVGVAAPQVGIYKSLAILIGQKDDVFVLINPTIVGFGGRDILDVEGCLSLPPAHENQYRVRRSEKIDIEVGTLEDPFAKIRSSHSGLEARIIQHEIDHLNPDGEVFFIDRLGPVARGQALRRFVRHRQEMDAKVKNAAAK